LYYAVLSGEPYQQVDLASLYLCYEFGRWAVLGTINMPRSKTVLHCAYVDCKARTDQRSFGQPRNLTADQLTSYSIWLKPSHDEVICNYHHTLLRRLLEKQQQAAAEAEARRRMESLMAAAAMADSSPTSAESSLSVSPVLPPSTVLVTISETSRSSSVPAASSLSTCAAPLRRSVSMPLLRTGHRGCTADQRMRIAFTCAMSGVTWTTWNRLEANLYSQSMSKATWYRLTKKVWKRSKR
jgi:hypothetical protein